MTVPRAVAPPGWPASVRPPGSEGWERSAVDWLLDNAPPEFRGYPALRRHPVLLARFVVVLADGAQGAVRHGLSEIRSELRDQLDLDVIEAGVATLHREADRLAGVRRAAGLVEEALRGRRFVARL